jgi:hypothetical protein
MNYCTAYVKRVAVVEEMSIRYDKYCYMSTFTTKTE